MKFRKWVEKKQDQYRSAKLARDMQVALNYEHNAPEEELKNFRKAVDLYRLGDELQLEKYEKASEVLAGGFDTIDKLGMALQKQEAK